MIKDLFTTYCKRSKYTDKGFNYAEIVFKFAKKGDFFTSYVLGSKSTDKGFNYAKIVFKFAEKGFFIKLNTYT